MALQRLNNKPRGLDPSALKVGDVIKGYFIGVSHRKAKTKDGKAFTSPDLILQGEDGIEFTVYPKGSIRYFEEDVVKRHKLKPGTWVELTCIVAGEKLRFDPAADPEKTITVEDTSGGDKEEF